MKKLFGVRFFFLFPVIFAVFGIFQFVYQGKPVLARNSSFDIIAHRGVSQTFSQEGIDNHTCTAKRIFKPRHNYLENSVQSINAAFGYGATIVEIDIRITKDNHLVVFHDYGLECRTNGTGLVIDHNLDYIRSLDIGYGYTFDNGETFPFRGKGVGGIKTLPEILNIFPDKKFLINNKNGNNILVAELLSDVLLKLPDSQVKNIYLWTEDKAFEVIKNKVPSIRRLMLPRKSQKNFFIKYLLCLGLCPINNEYGNEGLGLPVSYTKYIPGWPNRFLNKLYSRNIRFYLLANNSDDFKAVSDLPLDGIITDNIDLFSQYIK